MKRFNALKRVNAKPMTRQEYNDFRGWSLPEEENGDDEGYLIEDINGPTNTNEFMGYVSWLPKDMFENQFYEPDERSCGESFSSNDECPVKEGDEFDFGSAVYLLKTGKKVARKGWNSKGMFLYYIPANSYPASRNTLETLKGEFENDMVPYGAYIAMKTAQGNVVPWLASQSDVLAEDWILA